MNVYFLVEGRRTEMILYPAWIQLLKPAYQRLDTPFILNSDPNLDNTFYLFSGRGFPSILNHLEKSIEDVNKIAQINYLVVCLDADDRSVDETKRIVTDFINENGLILNSARLIILVQKCCIETWLLGNRRFFSRNATDPKLLECINFFDILNNDPELMEPISNQYNKAQYHEYYLRQLFKARNTKYSKKQPGDTIQRHYLDELIRRQQDTNHISSFGEFMSFCNLL